MNAGENWGYWLAGDLKRHTYREYIGITVPGSSIHPSFTCTDINRVYRILTDLTKRDSEESGLVENRNRSENELK